MENTDFKREKTLARRAARTRRSKWLSKILMSVFGISAMLFVRTQPEAVAHVMTWVQTTSHTAQADTKQVLTPIRTMPKDKVLVRRGTSTQTKQPAENTQTRAQAEALAQALQKMKAGG